MFIYLFLNTIFLVALYSRIGKYCICSSMLVKKNVVQEIQKLRNRQKFQDIQYVTQCKQDMGHKVFQGRNFDTMFEPNYLNIFSPGFDLEMTMSWC